MGLFLKAALMDLIKSALTSTAELKWYVVYMWNIVLLIL
jgi:hypothetical protein